MRIRLFGHYMHLPVVTLALAEFLAFGLSVYAAVTLRLGTDHEAIVAENGAVWPRALIFGCSMSVCFLAMGLYTTRQRAGTVGLGLRMVIASVVATAVLATLFYALPQVRLGEGRAAHRARHIAAGRRRRANRGVARGCDGGHQAPGARLWQQRADGFLQPHAAPQRPGGLPPGGHGAACR
ncbi:MAG: hypothetical protein IPM70_07930 [Proteobacteria bacterium]|nr:hypothetical protein [Pseudomonadota bacterium]